ncbi:MAG: hemolysin family protein [Microvirga sp.]
MFELIIAAVLIALNGLFSLSELAVVSARKVRLKTLANQMRPGAAAALRLAENPGRFLSSVQVCITLVGIAAGAFSGAALGQRLTEVLQVAGVPDAAAEPLGYGFVIGLITYFSVVVGELVPKHLALKDPEGIACLVAPLMTFIARSGSPIVSLLDASTKLLFRLFGLSTEAESAVTEEEVKTIVAEAEAAGAIETDERNMIAGVLRLGDRTVRGVMTPRSEIEWIDLNEDDFEIRERLIGTTHSSLPAGEGSPDNMVGVVQVRDLMLALLKGEPLTIRAHVRRAPVVPDTIDALDALSVLRQAEVPMALIHDEYGHFEGVLTPADILDAIAGAFRSDTDAEPAAVQREDGSWLLAGSMPANEMADELGVSLPEQRDYETVAGLVIGALQHLPTTGEAVEAHGWRFEVVDMDGRRVDKILASRLPRETEPFAGLAA